MNTENQFDDIRPYREEEIPAAMERIADSVTFPLLAPYVFPHEDIEKVRNKIRSLRTVHDFQLEVMRHVNEQVIERSMTSFTYNGMEALSTAMRYLFVSNHRDIMLDACLLQYVLYLYGHDTSEITFGANLMQGQLVTDIGKSNKMFRVERPDNNPRGFYKASLHLSLYIRHVITQKRQSVWIAQRNGRTKDGIDRTDQGLIKMFGISYAGDKVDALAELNIVPVAVSYEWEPCDILKALELYSSMHTKYIKKPGEDLNSILTGVTQPKGRVHFEICDVVSRSDLEQFADCSPNEFNRSVAALIDERICRAYRLTPNNYIAHDKRYNSRQYSDRYDSRQEALFTDRLHELRRYQDLCDMDTLTDIFLGIYSNPVDSKQKFSTL